MKRKLFQGFFGLVTLALCVCVAAGALAGCGKGGETPGTDPGGQSDPVYSVSLDATALTVEMTETKTLTATLSKDGAQTDEAWAAEWTSSDESVAAVSGGVVTGVKAGSATVTASYAGKSASCAVTVTASHLPGIVVGAGEAGVVAVMLDKTFALSPYVVYNGKTFTDGTFSYVSGDPEIVSVGENGLLTGHKIGSTAITVKGQWRGFTEETLSIVVPVSVAEDLLVGIDTPSAKKLSSTGAEIAGYDVPHTVQLTASVVRNGVKEDNPALTWASSDESVATVTEAGLLTGLSAGTTNVTVTYTTDSGSYTSVPVSFTVEFPYLDKTETIDLGDLDASAAVSGGVTVRAADVFGANPPAITAIFDVTGEVAAPLTMTGSGTDALVTQAGMQTGPRVWEIRNAEYAYKVSLTVATKIIGTADELLTAFKYPAGNSTPVTYGKGTYYILGDNIDAAGKKQGKAYWANGANAGFEGFFDGRGYTVNGLTVQSGGLFGHLAGGSVVKNFALTNVIIDGNSWQPVAIATNIFSDSTVENVFIHIASVTEEAKATNSVRAFANLVRGNNSSPDTMPVIRDVVVAMTSTDAADPISSFAEKTQPGNDGNYSNVHVVSDNYMLATGCANGRGDLDTAGEFTGVTRYGQNAEFASFAARYGEGDVLAATGLNSDYWAYSEAAGYPVFKTYLDAFFSQAIRAAFDALPAALSYDAGTGGSFTVPAACGGVTLTLSGSPSGVSVSDKTLTADADAAAGTFTLTVASGDVSGLEKAITVKILSAAEIAEREAREAFAGLAADSTAREYQAGQAAEWIPDAALGSVSLTLSDGAPSGVSVADGKLVIAATAPAGNFAVTVTSTQYQTDGAYLSAVVNFTLLSETVTVSALTELSQDAADNLLSLGHADITAAGGAVSCKGPGETAFTAVSADHLVFAAGTATFTADYLKTLSAGAYRFRVQLVGKVVEFSNVMVYTNVITTFAEFKTTFSCPVPASNNLKTYGDGAYYVLGNNIEAGGQEHYRIPNWINYNYVTEGKIGFMGTFDGKGYTVDNVVLQRGGMFGALGATAVVKNFAVTNATFKDVTGGENEALAYVIAPSAAIENIMVHVKGVDASSTGLNTWLVANSLRGNKADNKFPTMKNAILVMDIDAGVLTGSKKTSLSESLSTGNYAAFENVGVVADYSLFTTEVSGVQTDLTLYGRSQNTYSAAKPAADGLAQTGLSADYWTYEAGMSYPIFTSALTYFA